MDHDPSRWKHATDVLERVAAAQSADPATDDLTVCLALEVANLHAEVRKLKATLDEIEGLYQDEQERRKLDVGEIDRLSAELAALEDSESIEMISLRTEITKLQELLGKLWKEAQDLSPRDYDDAIRAALVPIREVKP